MKNFILLLIVPTIIFSQSKNTIPNFSNPFPNKVLNHQFHQNTQSTNDSLYFENIVINTRDNGSFSYNFRKDSFSKELILEKFNQWTKLGPNHTFEKVSEKIDEELNITHLRYQQYYKNIPIEGCVLGIRVQNDIVNSIAGQVSQFEDLDCEPKISIDKAKKIVQDDLESEGFIDDDHIEMVIIRARSTSNSDVKLAYKIGASLYDFYIDAQTGDIIKKLSSICNIDTPGTASTYYSGVQNITCDSYAGGYRLKDNARNIHTYNATYAQMGIALNELNTSNLAYYFQPENIDGLVDFYSSGTNFSGLYGLGQITLSFTNPDWWYATWVDTEPIFYIQIRDGDNALVSQVSALEGVQTPTFSFPNIGLTNPPYTFSVYEYDFLGADDYGGTYNLILSEGVNNYGDSNCSGNYLIGYSANPATDVHWGMEKTYDYFLNTHNLDSYDGQGSRIINYVNFQQFYSSTPGGPNNASAVKYGANVMMYGIGGSLGPVVALDVQGHEFSHLVVANSNASLLYENESGALDESFSDIFGTCVEFESGISPDWLIGSDLTNPLRDMSNPESYNQPDTYGVYAQDGGNWVDPTDLNYDNGGVHVNSGVQNYWFYLLCEGGSGTNDLGNSYNVSPIGMEKAEHIAFKTLTYYLSSNTSTFEDSREASLEATAEEYGFNSSEYIAVNNAWYAVGLGGQVSTNNFCTGETLLEQPSGIITDGSGAFNYTSNSDCRWVIKPAGASQVTLQFTDFDLEANYDYLYVYDGPNPDTSPLIETFTGGNLPQSISTTFGTGAMSIKFSSDDIVNNGGFTANYTSYGVGEVCEDYTLLTSSSGSFSDGSGASAYSNNQFCIWHIAPPCANTVTLSFSIFNTESGYDGVVVYDGEGTQLAELSGPSIPNSVTSYTGDMYVVFLSDFMTCYNGFSANYTSSGAYESGTTVFNQSDYATFSDGSGDENYCNNLNSNWLIQPPNATSVTLNFTEFNLEESGSEGTIYDAVSVYDGTSDSAPLLGVFTGSNIPSSITSSSGSMFINFSSDPSVTKEGWTAYYTSTQNIYCQQGNVLTDSSGYFLDGSGILNYANNSNCNWLIQPPNAETIVLNFTDFNTEENYDGVIVYDGVNNLAPILGQFTGLSIPDQVTALSGSMFIEFLSDIAVSGEGFVASYYSTTNVIYGCTDINACNYNNLATANDGSCEYPQQYYDCNGDCLLDSDNDNDCNELDNCVNNYNPNQLNSDGDLYGNACDNCPYIANSSQSDNDDDTVGNACDNCPDEYNLNQEDSDNDGIGDACDPYPLSIEEETIVRKLIKVNDVLGREISKDNNDALLFFLYDDGSIEKKYNLK